MNELQEEIDAINFAETDELSLVIGVGWRTFLANLCSLWPLILICAAIPAAITAAIPFDEITARLHMSVARATRFEANVESWLVIPFSVIMMLTAMVASVRALVGRRLGVRADFKTAMRRLPAAIVAMLLVFLVLFGAICLLGAFAASAYVSKSVALGLLLIPLLSFALVAAIYYGTKFSFAIQSVVIGGTSGLDAFRESSIFVRGRWWATFGVCLVVGVIGMMCSLPSVAATMVGGVMLALADNFIVKFLSHFGITAISLAGGIFANSAFAVFYLLRRKRTLQCGFENFSSYRQDEGDYGQDNGNE